MSSDMDRRASVTTRLAGAGSGLPHHSTVFPDSRTRRFGRVGLVPGPGRRVRARAVVTPAHAPLRPRRPGRRPRPAPWRGPGRRSGRSAASATPSAPPQASAHSTGRPEKHRPRAQRQRGQRVLARCACPRPRRPRTPRSGAAARAAAMPGRATAVGIAPSSCRPPWLETITPAAPARGARRRVVRPQHALDDHRQPAAESRQPADVRQASGRRAWSISARDHPAGPGSRTRPRPAITRSSLSRRLRPTTGVSTVKTSALAPAAAARWTRRAVCYRSRIM